MRKALAILLVLVILSASGIIAAHAVVNEQRDQVVVGENVIYGDKAAAYGLTVTNKSSWQERLHWSTIYAIDKENCCNTDFHFTQQREYERSVRYTPEGLSFGMSVGSGMSSSHEITYDDISRLCYGYEEICLDVMERAPAGEEYTEIVQVSDYLETFPLQVYMDLPNLFALRYDEYRDMTYAENLEGQDFFEINEAFDDYFRFPVNDKDLIEVRVYKNENGYVTELSVSTWEYTMEYRVLSAVTDEAAYFVFDCGNDIDFSNAKAGCGIYCLPFGKTFEHNGAVYPTIDLDGLDMVYPLETSVRIEEIFYDEIYNRLVLITSECGNVSLISINPDTMETMQTLDIATCESEEGYECVWRMEIAEDFIFIYLSNGCIAVVAQNENGEYSLGFVAPFNPTGNEELFWYKSSSAMAYDGERLALGWNDELEDTYNESCGFCIAVYDKTGLLYYGKYSSSLMTGRHSNHSGYYCFPAGNSGIVLAWE